MEYYENSNELQHYGVKGMKWGVRRAEKYTKKANIARISADEWDEMAGRARTKGKMNKAEKYTRNANEDRSAAKIYENKAKTEIKKQDFRDARSSVSKSRSLGAKVATNIVAGPFANRTYNSVLASGGSKTKALGVTVAAALIGGPTGLGHVVVSSLYTSDAANKK